MMNVNSPVLRVENLEVTYYTDAGRAKALDDVSFTLNAGEKLGMVGESGSGKSTLALAMMRMIKPPGRIEGGRVTVGDTDLMALGVSSGLLHHSTSFSGSLEIGGPVHGTWHSRVPRIPSTEHCSAYLSSL